MNAKSVGVIITFAAIAIVLNVVRIPAFFYPGNFFQISQIPIIVAFLLFGPRIGILVGVINLIGQLALFPVGPSRIIGYSMDFVSALVMFAGLQVANRLMKRDNERESFSFWNRPIVGLTASAGLFRGLIMSLVDFGLLFHLLVPLFLGVNLTDDAILGLVPAFVLYNLIVAFYTVPIAYFLAQKIGKALRIVSPPQKDTRNREQ